MGNGLKADHYLLQFKTGRPPASVRIQHPAYFVKIKPPPKAVLRPLKLAFNQGLSSSRIGIVDKLMGNAKIFS